jgi:hypothetical protein
MTNDLMGGGPRMAAYQFVTLWDLLGHLTDGHIARNEWRIAER